MSLPSCPECGRAMILRNARKGRNAGGQFWGCQGYPACRGVRDAGADTEGHDEGPDGGHTSYSSGMTVIGWCGIPSQPRYQARRTDPRVFHGWVSEQVQCMVWAQELPAQGCTQLCSEEP